MSLPRVLQDLFFLRFFIDFAPVLSHIPTSTSLVNFDRESTLVNAFLFEELKKRNLCNNNSENILP